MIYDKLKNTSRLTLQTAIALKELLNVFVYGALLELLCFVPSSNKVSNPGDNSTYIYTLRQIQTIIIDNN